jgi:hypothetical protein
LTGINAGSWTTGLSSGNNGLPTFPGNAIGLIANVWNTAGSETLRVRATGDTTGYIDTAGVFGAWQSQMIVPLNGSQQFDFYSGSATGNRLTILGYFITGELGFPGGNTYSPVQLTPTLTATHQLLNTSSYLPAGATGAILYFNAGGSYGSFSARYGLVASSSDNFTSGNATRGPFYEIIGCDGSQNISAASGGATGANVVLLAWLTSTAGLVWNVNGQSTKNVGSGMSAATWAALATESNATGYIYEVWESGSTSYTYSINNSGSGGLNPNIPPGGLTVGQMSTGAASGNATPYAYLSSVSGISVYERGYFSSAVTTSSPQQMLLGVG